MLDLVITMKIKCRDGISCIVKRNILLWKTLNMLYLTLSFPGKCKSILTNISILNVNYVIVKY